MNSKYKVEKNVPIPEVVRTRNVYGGKNIDILRQMQVGDSILVNMSGQAALSRFYNPARRMGIRITTRKVGDNVGIWRIE